MRLARWRWLRVAGAVLLPLTVLVVVLLPTRAARGKTPAGLLAGDFTPQQARARALALADERVQALIEGRRAEVFNVLNVGAQYTAASAACAQADCRQVELYDFDNNTAVTVIVDLDAGLVRDVLVQPGTHPAANRSLIDRANEIARSAPELTRELGYRPGAEGLAFMDGGLPGSDCDREHLCLAAAVPDGKSMVWVVVDMTTETIGGVVRTPVQPESTQPAAASAGDGTCPSSGSVARDGWTLSYETTPTDGFRVYNVAYQGIEALSSAKIVEWHVDYGTSGFVDSTGCGGASGFTIYPYGGTEITNTVGGETFVGFEVRQDFRMLAWGSNCNYRYQQRYQFFVDGRFRVVGAAFGRGCSNSGMYRPVMRLDIAVAGDGGDTFAQWDGSAWQGQMLEGWWPQTAQTTPEGYAWRVTDGATGRGYFIEPGQGQFDDNGRGDFAFMFATRHQAAQGDTDLGSIGNCCFDDQRQGPDAYLNGESISGQDLVLWYVPQMQTEVVPGNYYCWTVTGEPLPETYPCPSGPMFVPLQLFLNYLPLMGR